MAGIVFAVVDKPMGSYPYTVQKRVGGLRGTVAHFPDLDAAVSAAGRYAACYEGAAVSVEAKGAEATPLPLGQGCHT
jgi:hypothetical protein